MNKLGIKPYLKIARLDHWIKQLFIVPGIILSLAMEVEQFNIKIAINILLGLLATSMAASANYVINEWLDAEFDKYHPIKKYRPCVAEGLDTKIVYLEYFVFIVLSLIISYTINRLVLLSIVALLIMGVVYNVKPIRTKDITYLDVISESVNNAIRFIIGWFCVSTLYYPPLSFVMGYWTAGAFLMAAKRFAEYKMINDIEQAKLYRKSFSGYTELTLLLSSIFYGFMAVFFCGVFLIKYRIEMILVIPFICVLFCYYLGICFKPDSAAQRPEKLFHEKKLMIFVVAILVIFIILYTIRIPSLNIFLRTELVPMQ